MDILLLDFDGTITQRDTTRDLVFALLSRRPWRLFPILGDVVRLAIGGTSAEIQCAKDRCVGTLLGGLCEGQIRASLELYRQRVATLIRPAMAALIRERAESGQKILVVTASAEFAVEVALEDFPVTVLGTRFEVRDARFTGEVAGVPCYGAGKVPYILNWLSESDDPPNVIEGWSDSLTDRPMLDLAKRRVWICSRRRARLFRELDPLGEIFFAD